MSAWHIVTAATALAAAATGGALWTYSTFTTAGLARLPAAEGLSAMQQINGAAPRSVSFMGLIFGPALMCVVLGVRAIATQPPGSGWVLAGGVVYVVGVVVVTLSFHVPRNDVLDSWDPMTHADGFPAWLSAWVAGNHVRTAAGVLSASLLAWSLRSG